MQLSKRMELLASKVTEGHRLADIGTDHGYIPIALVQRGKIPSAIAMDVNRGPLERAQEHIRACGLDTYIETRLSDGLHKLTSGEADTVLIAGMGGMLMSRILEEGSPCLYTVKELILQPQSEIYLVREWLYDNGFHIAEEDIIEDDGKYYPMMKAVHGSAEKLKPSESVYGMVKIQKSPEVLMEYLKKRLAKDKEIMGCLRHAGREDSERMAMLVQDAEWIENTMSEVVENHLQRSDFL